MWNALALEEQVIAILNEIGEPDWNDARRLTAGGLEKKLERVGLRLEQGSLGLVAAIAEAVKAFSAARVN